ncbi:MAG: pyridoxamine 5'-phosphate oxidase family protein [Candidatus Saccharimonadales bacterium]
MQVQEKNGNVDGWRPTHTEVYEWLKEQPLGVLSTLNEAGAPQSATVAFSVTEFGDLLVGTSEGSRKSQNIDHDSRVAFTITDSERRITVQIEGVARKLAQVAFEMDYEAEHYKQRPESLPFKDEPGQCHIFITPQHVRFSDCRPKEWAITEY